MIDGVFGGLAQSLGLSSLLNESEPQVVTIRIKKTDPRLPDLLKLASVLATSEVLDGGITVEHLMRPGAVDQILDALRPFGINVDKIREDLSQPNQPTLTPEKVMPLAKDLSKLLPFFRGMAGR